MGKQPNVTTYNNVRTFSYYLVPPDEDEYNHHHFRSSKDESVERCMEEYYFDYTKSTPATSFDKAIQKADVVPDRITMSR